MKKEYKGIIFDLDGTLVDTIEDIADSMNEILIKYKEETYSYDQYKQLVGRGFDNLIIDNFNRKINDSELKEIRKDLDKAYSRNYLNKSKAYDGIEEVLKELKRNRIQIGINTNKKDEYAKDIMNNIFPDIEFIKIVGQIEGKDVKPNPIGALNIIDKMGLKQEEVLYVGDSNVDILTGKNAMIDTLGVSWGFRGRSELEDYSADYVIDEVDEILKILSGNI